MWFPIPVLILATSFAELNNTGARHHLRGAYPEAEHFYRQALATPGLTTSDRLKILVNLATVTRHAGDLPRSAQYLTEAARLGDSPVLQLARAQLFRDQGDLRRARSIAERLLREAPLRRHQAAATELLAQIARDLRDFPESERLWTQASDLWTAEEGPLSEHNSTALNNLSELATAQGQHSLGESFARRALELSEQIWGPHHRRAAIARNNLAQALRLQGVTAGVEDLYLRSIDDLRPLGPSAASDLALFLGNLADFYHAQGRAPRAVACYREALRLVGSRGGSQHASLLAALADVRASQGHFLDALRLYRESTPQLEAAWGMADPRLVRLRQRIDQTRRLAELYFVEVH